MKKQSFLIAVVISSLLMSSFSIHDAYAESKSKARFWGNHEMFLYGEAQIDFRIDPLTWTPYIVNGTVQIGNEKLFLSGGGMIKPDYYYYDKQCKSLKGFEYLFSEKGDSLRIDYFGKVCYMGMNIKTVNLIFSGKDAKGIFENAKIEGTFSGTSDRYEKNYDLMINSILVYNGM